MTALYLSVMHSAKNPSSFLSFCESERGRNDLNILWFISAGSRLAFFSLPRLRHRPHPHGRANKFLNNHNSWFYGRNGARWPSAITFSLSLSSLLRFVQSVAKQLVCFVRGLSDRLRADNRQTIRWGCFASRDSRRAISPASLARPPHPSLQLQTGCINSGAMYIISNCSNIIRNS